MQLFKNIYWPGVYFVLAMIVPPMTYGNSFWSRLGSTVTFVALAGASIALDIKAKRLRELEEREHKRWVQEYEEENAKTPGQR